MLRKVVGGVILTVGVLLWVVSLVGWFAYVLARPPIFGMSEILIYMGLGFLAIVIGVLIAPYEIPLDIESMTP